MTYERGYQFRDIPGLPGQSRFNIPLTPADPSRLTGPERGATVLYIDKYGLGPAKVKGVLITVRVIESFYHWSPEVVLYKDNTPIGRGYIHYDWSVIEFRPNGDSMVVNDTDLIDPATLPIGSVVSVG